MQKQTKILLGVLVVCAVVLGVYFATSSGSGNGIGGGGSNDNLLKDFTYESRVDGFTPKIVSTTTHTITGTVNDTPQELTLVVPIIETPTDIVKANYKAVIFAADFPEANEIVKSTKDAFGADNVTMLDITKDQKNLDAFHGVAKVLSPFNEPQVGIPLGIILDEDGTLLAVFDWPLTFTDKDHLYAIATVGKAYSGVYSPLPVYGFDVNIKSFTLLTDEQKIQIRDAMQEVYPIKLNID